MIINDPSLEKTTSSMDLYEEFPEATVTETRLLQLEKAPLPKDVTPSGIIIEVRLLQPLNA